MDMGPRKQSEQRGGEGCGRGLTHAHDIGMLKQASLGPRRHNKEQPPRLARLGTEGELRHLPHATCLTPRASR